MSPPTPAQRAREALDAVTAMHRDLSNGAAWAWANSRDCPDDTTLAHATASQALQTLRRHLIDDLRTMED